MTSKSKKMQYNNKKELVVDVIKDFLAWVVVTAVAFVWWLAVLLIFSLILINVWKTSFDSLLQYSIVLMSVTSLAYLVWVIYKRFRA